MAMIGGSDTARWGWGGEGTGEEIFAVGYWGILEKVVEIQRGLGGGGGGAVGDSGGGWRRHWGA